MHDARPAAPGLAAQPLHPAGDARVPSKVVALAGRRDAGAPGTDDLSCPDNDRRLHARPSLSCVLPCRNEAANLERLLPRLQQTLSTLADRWEIILVDDGSQDATPAVFARWSREGSIRALQLSRNFGKEAALSAGLDVARGDVVVTMDSDLQHDPALIAVLLQAWREGADVAYAVKRDRDEEGWLKRVGSRAFYALVNGSSRFAVPPDAGDFRLMDRQVVDAINALPERNRFMKGLYAWVGFRAVAVPYTPAERGSGRSSFGGMRLLALSLDGLTAFSTWPLRAVSITGFVMAALAFVYGAWLVISYFLEGHVVSGWTTIVVSLLLLAGIQLVSLGVVGEYVGRAVEESKARPLYVVRRELGRGLPERDR